MPQHWIVVSSPSEYSAEQFAKQKLVHWDAGFCVESNKLLSQMKKRDTVLFMTSGELSQIQVQAVVAQDAFPDPQQNEPTSKRFREDSNQIFFIVPLRFCRQFSHPISWMDVQSSHDPQLEGLPVIRETQCIYSITLAHHKKILSLSAPSRGVESAYPPVEQILPTTISESEITKQDVLGSGQYGTVYRALFRHSIVAAKVLSADVSELTTEEIEKLKVEAKILQHIHCPHIIKFYGACITNNNITIVTELMSKGELGALLLKTNVALSDFQKIRMGLDIAVGMNWLHTSRPHQFIHRDLKPSNLLVDNQYRVKICDFGFCQVKDPNISNLQPSGRIGTLKYMAPEVIKNGQFSEKIDVYSFGLIFWEILTRKRCFEQFGEREADMLMSHVLKGGRPEIPKDYIFRDLLERCWHQDPDVRPSFDQIVVEISATLTERFIPDPVSRSFWNSFQSVCEVEWDRFEAHLRSEIHESYFHGQLEDLPRVPTPEQTANCSDYQLNTFAALGADQRRIATDEALRRYDSVDEVFKLVPELDLELKCLRKLLRVDENNGKVLLNHWGNILRWFGPLYDANHFPTFLCRIKLLLRTKYFHGYLTEAEANNRLKQPNEFLLRFSSRSGYFSLSFVTEGHNVENTRIERKNEKFRLSNTVQEFYSLQSLISLLIKKYKWKPVYASLYDDLFANKSETNDGYTSGSTLFPYKEDYSLLMRD